MTSFTELFDLKKVKHELVAYKEVAVEMSDWLVDLRGLSAQSNSIHGGTYFLGEALSPLFTE